MNSSLTYDVLAIANLPFLWVLASAVSSVIVIQSVIYLLAVRRNAAAADMTKHEVTQAFRAVAVAAIGPSLTVVLVSLALLPLFGTPPVPVRVGLIGSAATEIASASAAAGTLDAQLGGATWTQPAFLVTLFAMSLSGAGWMLATLILTPILSRGSSSITNVNPALMAIVPTAALLAAFTALTVQELPKSSVHALAIIASAATMTVCLLVAKKLDFAWLRERPLGFAIFAGLFVAYLSSSASRGVGSIPPHSCEP